MKRIVLSVLLSSLFFACGPKPKPIPDSGMEEEDAGMEVDAGRPRGDDLPNGWQMALELPAGAAASTKLGISTAAIPDQFGYPTIAALYEDPNGDLNYDDNRVVYTVEMTASGDRGFSVISPKVKIGGEWYDGGTARVKSAPKPKPE